MDKVKKISLALLVSSLMCSVQLLATDALEYEEWLDSAGDKCLTIADVEKMQPGERIRVLVMDRNLGDTCLSVNEPAIVYTAQKFFAHNTAYFTRKQELQGKLEWVWNDQNTVDDADEEFEFHIEYAKGNWYPLTNGKLPEEDPQGFFHFPNGTPRDWRQFPKTTCLGWRGPMMQWELVAEQADVYFRD
ncbi:hypothetical protein EHM76_01265 [bacterium]|nr:MAG: hypothetical protein EHM76_01265 [bacterium]